MNIYVGNLPYSVNNDELTALFSEFGDVKRATVMVDRETKRSRGFGFVEMADESDGAAAIEAVNGRELNKRVLSVTVARPKPAKPQRRTA